MKDDWKAVEYGSEFPLETRGRSAPALMAAAMCTRGRVAMLCVSWPPS